MPPEPLYTPENLRQPAYQLRYTWCAWPSQNHFPDEPTQPFLEGLTSYWENDGLRMLEYRWEPSRIQVTFSTKPHVPPVFLARQAKGRLQHALRVSGSPTPFCRKVSVGTVGDNTKDDVDSYIANQVVKEPVLDERFREKLRPFMVVNPDVDLTSPTSTKRGRYWYNLHLVLIVEKREKLNDLNELATIRDRSLKLAGFCYGLLNAVSVPIPARFWCAGSMSI